MNEVYQVLINFLVTLIVACTPIVVGFVVAWIKAKTDEIKSRMVESLSDNQKWALEFAVKQAVQAAEQSGLRDLALNKKEFAIKSAESYLKSLGFDIDLDVIADAIEAAVWTELNEKDPNKNEALASSMKCTTGVTGPE
jgi:hypothetical protein